MKPRRYAEGTDVSVDTSRNAIEHLLRHHGATEFAYYTQHASNAVIRYRIVNRMVQHVLEYPSPKPFLKDARGSPRKPEAVGRLREAEWRRRWRALLLITKAKLEFVASGQSTLERELFADLLLPDGSTVSAAISPRLADAYDTGQMPELLPGVLPKLLGKGPS